MRFFVNYFSSIWAHNLGLLKLYTGNGAPLDTPLYSKFRNSIFLAVFVDEGSFLEGALRPELVITPFAERFKAAAIISKSY